MCSRTCVHSPQTRSFLEDSEALLHQRGDSVAALLRLLHDLVRFKHKGVKHTLESSHGCIACTNITEGDAKELALGALLAKQAAHHRSLKTTKQSCVRKKRKRTERATAFSLFSPPFLSKNPTNPFPRHLEHSSEQCRGAKGDATRWCSTVTCSPAH